MFPSAERHYSPIWVQEFAPQKTGARMLQPHFYHANYPEGVQEKVYDLHILHRSDGDLLTLTHVHGSLPPRLAPVGIASSTQFRSYHTIVLSARSVPEELAVRGRIREVGGAPRVSTELRAPFPAALCHGARGPERRQRLSGVESGPRPLTSSRSDGANTRAACAFIASDAMSFAEPAKIERADPQAESFKMRPHLSQSPSRW